MTARYQTLLLLISAPFLLALTLWLGVSQTFTILDFKPAEGPCLPGSACTERWLRLSYRYSTHDEEGLFPLAVVGIACLLLAATAVAARRRGVRTSWMWLTAGGTGALLQGISFRQGTGTAWQSSLEDAGRYREARAIHTYDFPRLSSDEPAVALGFWMVGTLLVVLSWLALQGRLGRRRPLGARAGWLIALGITIACIPLLLVENFSPAGAQLVVRDPVDGAPVESALSVTRGTWTTVVIPACVAALVAASTLIGAAHARPTLRDVILGMLPILTAFALTVTPFAEAPHLVRETSEAFVLEGRAGFRVPALALLGLAAAVFVAGARVAPDDDGTQAPRRPITPVPGDKHPEQVGRPNAARPDARPLPREPPPPTGPLIGDPL